MATIGIRREDKNRWERRVPLIPADLATLKSRHGLRFLVQTSPIRIHTDDEYRQAGAEIVADLAGAELVLAVKEIPLHLLLAQKAYVYFAHVIKGQPYNMPMLRRLLELGCSLVDYERITDDQGRRLIFFSLHAGYAGMLETLWGLGRRLQALGLSTPLVEVKHAYEYEDLSAARLHLHQLGERIRAGEWPGALRPLVIGIAGYGNASQGVQEILASLGTAAVEVTDLPEAARRDRSGAPPLLHVVFKEEDMVRPWPGGAFELQDYYRHPEKYSGRFAEHLDHLDVLVNTIYWDERYPRLVTREWARSQVGPSWRARLQVIGDISMDIAGSIELTVAPTEPEAPCYTYEPQSGGVQAGVSGDGPVIMAVDNLPCELPREASSHFSSVLRDMVPALAAADWRAELDDLVLPAHLRRALIVHRGRLTPEYQHLARHLENLQGDEDV
jgi:saccharopine dehydrogenase (NAD+, L-lysine-forming)